MGASMNRLVISTPQGKVNGWEAKAFFKEADGIRCTHRSKSLEFYLFSALRAVRTHITSSPERNNVWSTESSALDPTHHPTVHDGMSKQTDFRSASTNANADPLPVELNVECQLVEFDYGPSGDVEIQTQVFAQGLFIPWGIAFPRRRSACHRTRWIAPQDLLRRQPRRRATGGHRHWFER